MRHLEKPRKAGKVKHQVQQRDWIGLICPKNNERLLKVLDTPKRSGVLIRLALGIATLVLLTMSLKAKQYPSLRHQHKHLPLPLHNKMEHSHNKMTHLLLPSHNTLSSTGTLAPSIAQSGTNTDDPTVSAETPPSFSEISSAPTGYPEGAVEKEPGEPVPPSSSAKVTLNVLILIMGFLSGLV